MCRCLCCFLCVGFNLLSFVVRVMLLVVCCFLLFVVRCALRVACCLLRCVVCCALLVV